jgi:ATP-dependent DNA ligase
MKIQLDGKRPLKGICSDFNRWMTEKYDGARLYWSGTAFYTRQGRKLTVPESIKRSMPNVKLDGELW